MGLKTSKEFGGPVVLETEVLGSKALKESAGGKVRLTRVLSLEVVHELDDATKASGISKVHGSSSVDRPAVAIDPDDINVRGASGDALLEDLEALVDEGQHAAPEDLVVRDGSLDDLGLSSTLLDDRCHLRIFDSLSGALLVLVPAL